MRVFSGKQYVRYCIGVLVTAVLLLVPCGQSFAGSHSAELLLQAGEGLTLDSHQFSSYQVGTYTDVQEKDGVIDSLGVVNAGQETQAWLQPVLSSHGVSVQQGEDEAGALSRVQDASVLAAVAHDLAVSPSKPAPVSKVMGSGVSSSLSVPEEGLYLVTDSNGLPILLGTKAHGLSFKDQPLGVSVVKSNSLSVDKKILVDGKAVPKASLSAGDEPTFRATTTIPDSKSVVSYRLSDTMQPGMTYVHGSLTLSLTDGTKANSLVSIEERSDGFDIDASALPQSYPNKRLRLEYSTLVGQLQPGTISGNTLMVSADFRDGTTTRTVTSSDSTETRSWGLDVHKCDRESQDPLSGAVFIIGKPDSWLSLSSSGIWSTASNEETATRFTTNSSGDIHIIGLAAGTYRLKEVQAPNGHILGPLGVSFTATIHDDGSITVQGDSSPALSSMNHGVITVANIRSIRELPMTGGAGAAVVLLGVLALLSVGCACLVVGYVRSRKS